MISTFGELGVGVTDDVEVLEVAKSGWESPDAVLADIEPLAPPGTDWGSVSTFSMFWVLGVLAVGEIVDVGLLEVAESGFESFDAVVTEIGGIWVICVVLALAQTSGALRLVWVLALALITMLGVSWVFWYVAAALYAWSSAFLASSSSPCNLALCSLYPLLFPNL